MTNRLGIIAGGGALPERLIEACKTIGRPYFVLAFKGQTDPHILNDNCPHSWVRLGATNKAIQTLKSEGVTEIVMAGGMRRPSFFDLRPDLRTAKILMRARSKTMGDDGLLQLITSELEGEGFKVIGVQEIISEILTPEGNLGKHKPAKEDWGDINHGVKIAKTMGELDVGQAVIVQQGLVLGVEAIEGTDDLISRCAKLRRSGPGGVLVKMKKPQQDVRLDLPTVGVQTVKKAAVAGLSGIVLEAGGTILLDKEEAIATADVEGIFIIGINPNMESKEA